MRWKRGEQDPTPQALQLFRLHRDGRVLGQEWDGWRIVDGQLVDPEGNSTSQGQLRAYYLNYLLLHELMRGNDAARARWRQAMELAG